MPRPSAVILIIIDGLSDVSPHLLNARTPILDQAASRGRVGLLDPVRPGLACGSDTAHLSIFGYDPLQCYRGRGAFEAMGTGMDLQSGDIAFKCNFARMDQNGIVTARSAGRGEQVVKLAKQYAAELDGMVVDGVEVGVLHAGGHRCVVRLRGEDLSDRVSNTDPLLDGEKLLRAMPLQKGAERTASVLNSVSDRIRLLVSNCEGNVIGDVKPATNVVLLRGAAKAISVQSFCERHRLNAFIIAPTKIIAGIGKTIGMEVVKVRGATGGYDTDLHAKASTCVEKLMEKTDGWRWNFGVVHVKAVDEAGHEQDGNKKVLWLEKVDEMFADIMRKLWSRQRFDVVAAITGDHTTPTAFGDHTCEPVPVVFSDIFNPDDKQHNPPIHVPSDSCGSFDEVSAGMYGSLGRFPGSELMKMVKRLLLTPS